MAGRPDEDLDEERVQEDKDPFQQNEISVEQIRQNNDIDEEDNHFNDNDELKQKLQRFLLYYKNQKYYKILQRIKADDKSSITIDYDDIVTFDNVLYKNMLGHPKDFLSILKRVIYDIDQKQQWQYFNEDRYFAVKLAGYPNYKPIRTVDVSLNNQLISLRGHISKTSEKEPYIYKFYLKCPENSDHHLYSDFNNYDCPWCENHPDMRVVKNRNIYTSAMNVRIQELNEDLKGRVPMQLEVLVLGDECDIINPGMKVNLTGFVELYEKFGSVSLRKPYFLLIRANHIEPFQTNVFADGDIAITDKDVKEINERLKDRKGLLKILQESYAPHVLGHELEKLGMLIAIVGSAEIEIDGKVLRRRSHVALVGDPGTAKTDLLQFGEKITLGSVYVSGRGVSGGGVTALLLKDRDGRFSIQPGALIYANRSVLWFDESGQTSNDTKSHFHESMESGRISLAKGGYVTSLVADTTIVMAGNPKWSRYVPDKSVTENIDMPEPIVNRFDLIFIILDLIDPDHDREISRHIDRILVDHRVPIYGEDRMSIIQLIKYINYVKEKDITPIFTQEVLDMNEEWYVKVRQKSTPDAISITPRQKYGLARIQMAIARIVLSPKVERWIGELGILLMENMIKAVMTDEQGNINVSNASGKTVEKLKGAKLMTSIMLRLADEYEPTKIPKDQIRRILREEENMSDNAIEKFLDLMNQTGIISHTSERYVKLSGTRN